MNGTQSEHDKGSYTPQGSYDPRALRSQGPTIPGSYDPRALRSQGPTIPGPYDPRALRSQGPTIPGSYDPRALRSQGPGGFLFLSTEIAPYRPRQAARPYLKILQKA
ncbi:unnamed protein product [Arctogadus glacialis]